MKNFLKSTAIFVCAALMMGACTEDDTEDVGGDFVPTPTIESVQAGNEKAVLTWYTPDTNEGVTKCQISWVGPTIKGATTKDVVLDASQTYEITNEAETLIAGTYTVTLKNLVTSTGQYSESVTQTVDIYDSSMYDEPQITKAIAEGDDIIITWGTIDAECDSIRVNYYDELGIGQTVLIEDFTAEELTTTLTSAAFDSNITYYSYFMPEGGYDYVVLTSSYGVENLPVAPSAVTSYGGLNQFQVNWTVDLDEDEFESISHALITYCALDEDGVETGDEYTAQVNTYGESYLRFGDNSYVVTDVEEGDYNVYIQLFNKSGFSSDIEDEAAESNSIVVFGATSYAIPVIESIVNVNGVTTVYFAEEGVDEDCAELSITYLRSDYDDEEDTRTTYIDLSSVVEGLYSAEFTDGEEGSAITVVATFSPEGEYFMGDELVVDEVSEYTLPYLAPEAPTSMTVTLGYDTTESWINVEWDLPTDMANVAEVRLYYTAEDYVVVEDYESTTTYEFSTADDPSLIEVNNTYTIEVRTATGSGETAATSLSPETFIAKPYKYDSYNNNHLPTAEITTMTENSTAYIVFDWADIHEDLREIVLTYNSATYTYDVVTSEDGTTTLELSGSDITYAAGVNTYSYEATFYPDGGQTENTVKLTSTEFSVDGITPAVPTGVSGNSGYGTDGAGRIVVSWTDVSDANADAFYVYYYQEMSDDDDEDTWEATIDSIIVKKSDLSVNTLNYFEFELNNANNKYADGFDDANGDAGYTVYVKGYNESTGLISEMSAEVSGIYPYTEVGYYGAPEIDSLGYDEGLVTIMWADSVYSDLNSIKVTYSISDSETTTETINVGFGSKISSLEIPGAVPGTAIDYVASFCPIIGLNDVVVSVSDAYYVPSVAYDYSVQAGVEQENSTSSTYNPVVRIKWNMPSINNVEKVVAYYKLSTATTYTEVEYTDGNGLVTGDYELVIPAAQSGLIYNAYVGVVQRLAADAEEGEEAVEYVTSVERVTTYSSYNYMNVALPTPTIQLKGGDLSFVWSNYDSSDELVNVVVTIGEADPVAYTPEELAAGTIFENTTISSGATVEYVANYSPTGGADYVVREGSSVIPAATPTDPSSLKVVTGYDESDDKAYVRVSWNIEEGDPDMASSYVSLVGTGASYDYTRVYSSSETGDEGVISCEYTFSDVKVDTDYTVTLYNLAGEVKSDDILTATTRSYNSVTYSSSEPSVRVIYNETKSGADVVWSKLSDDIQYVAFTYNGRTYYPTMKNGVLSPSISITFDANVTTYDYEIWLYPSDGETYYKIVMTDVAFVDDLLYDDVNDVYEIYKLSGLIYFADVVNGTNVSGLSPTQNLAANATLMVDIDLSTICGEEVLDEDGAAISWIPIGDYSTSTSNIYTGTFDGNGFSISNMYIYTMDSKTHQAMFGYTSGATIKNLTIKSSSVESDANHAGLFVGRAVSSTLDNCHTDENCRVEYSSLTNTTRTVQMNFGGLIGVMAGTADIPTVVTGCSNSASIVYPLAANQAGEYGAGGIAGSFSSAVMGNKIINTVNYGYVYGGNNVAGFVGSSNTGGGLFMGCRNEGMVDGSITNVDNNSTQGFYIGGLVGRSGGSETSYLYFIGCSNTGEIKGTSGSSGMGGLAGRAYYVQFIGCFNTGALTNYTTSGKNVGALFGEMSVGYVEDCYFVDNEDSAGTVPGYTSATTLTGDGTGESSVILTVLNSSSTVNAMNAAVKASAYYTDYSYEYYVGSVYPLIQAAL